MVEIPLLLGSQSIKLSGLAIFLLCSLSTSGWFIWLNLIIGYKNLQADEHWLTFQLGMKSKINTHTHIHINYYNQ